MPELTTRNTSSTASEEEIFMRLGSPRNHLATLGSGEVGHSHYSQNQNDFACLSQEILISLIKNNNMRDILKLDHAGVDDEERRGMETMYKACADGRARIAKLTRKAPENDQEMREQESDMQRLSYRESENMSNTQTPLRQQDGKYNRYLGKLNRSEMLSLRSCVAALGEDVKPIDNAVTLGMMMPMLSSHTMGTYRNEPDETVKSEKVNRVDDITVLAAKKSLQACDAGQQEDALKYALIFCVLRGYNLRSEIGACHAQEESTRLLFDAIGVPQPKKMPGVYLDVEACCEPMFGGNGQEFQDLINAQVKDYIDSITNPEHRGDFFDIPIKATPENYSQYLQVTEKYKQKELLPPSSVNSAVASECKQGHQNTFVNP